jgi:hypothetical protein
MSQKKKQKRVKIHVGPKLKDGDKDWNTPLSEL